MEEEAELEEERKGFQNVLDVDAFLESCKSMGMMDYQLFNQSDVTTENGDLLSACRTIRFLALLCKSKGLEVRNTKSGELYTFLGYATGHSQTDTTLSLSCSCLPCFIGTRVRDSCAESRGAAKEHDNGGHCG